MQIDRYAIEEELGAGGYGRVYRARHLHMGREVALKVLLAASEKERFFREAEILSRLDHPNVVRVHDCGTTDDGEAFLALELLQGETLAERMRRTGAQPMSEALWIMDGVLQGLAAAHAVGVFHRDLKHPNIFLAHTDEGPVVKLLDFGIAKDSQAIALTAPGMRMGTPRYMAPEQVMTGQADARSDVWSAAIVLYEMLSGSLAYGGSADEALVAIASGPPPPLAPRAPGLPEPLYGAIETALSHDRAGRFASAEAFRAALRLASKRRTVPGVVSRDFATGILGQVEDVLPAAAVSGAATSAPAVVPEAVPVPVPSTPARRRTGVAVALAILAVALLAGGWAYSRSEPRPVAGVMHTAPVEPSLAEPRAAAEVPAPLPLGVLPPADDAPDEDVFEPPRPAVDPRARALLEHALPERPPEPESSEPEGTPASLAEALRNQDEAALQEHAAAALRLAEQLRGSTRGTPEQRQEAARELEHALGADPLDPTHVTEEVAITCDTVGFAPGVRAAHTGQIARALGQPAGSCARTGELQFTYVAGALRSVTRGSDCLRRFARRVVPARIAGLTHGMIRCTFE